MTALVVLFLILAVLLMLERRKPLGRRYHRSYRIRRARD